MITRLLHAAYNWYTAPWTVATLEDDARQEIASESEGTEPSAENLEDEDDLTEDDAEERVDYEALDDDDDDDADWDTDTDAWGEDSDDDEEDPAPDLVDAAKWNIRGTVTGRTSCATPNYAATCRK